MTYINGFKFLREVNNFDLSNYTPIITWIHSNIKPYKVYTSNLSNYYYLHDETINRMYEIDLEVGVDIFARAELLLTTYESIVRS